MATALGLANRLNKPLAGLTLAAGIEASDFLADIEGILFLMSASFVLFEPNLMNSNV